MCAALQHMGAFLQPTTCHLSKQQNTPGQTDQSWAFPQPHHRNKQQTTDPGAAHILAWQRRLPAAVSTQHLNTVHACQQCDTPPSIDGQHATVAQPAYQHRPASSPASSQVGASLDHNSVYHACTATKSVKQSATRLSFRDITITQ